MPNYDFKCLECGHCFQKLLPAGTKETKCLECGSCAEKQLAAPGVVFKGSGFYKTDSGTGGNVKKSAKAPDKPKDTGGSK
jgi:putative FmdB family regulatory protein